MHVGHATDAAHSMARRAGVGAMHAARAELEFEDFDYLMEKHEEITWNGTHESTA
jgi:hypothetical protein